ncbi:hypothetical protein E2C01_098659 [Portunus trituberculatus]|uniref:Uncharacterized protein n=1 Tax=Portunus trituberculatus TaxID=210409 RepID=A0A5B7K3G7_PORTR|nr:hypothetical protein [Portunus trituberculatus]
MRNGSVCRSVNGFAQLNARWPNTTGISPSASLGAWNPKYESPPVLPLALTSPPSPPPPPPPPPPLPSLPHLVPRRDSCCGAVLCCFVVHGVELRSLRVMLFDDSSLHGVGDGIVMVLLCCGDGVVLAAYCVVALGSCCVFVVLQVERYTIVPSLCYRPCVAASP